MRESTLLLLGCVAVLSAILAGCSTNDITIDDFVGTWTATKWTETNLVSPYQTADVIAAGGGWTVTIISDGSYTGTVTLPGPVVVPVSGTATILDNHSMVVQQGVDTFQCSYTLAGDTWVLTHEDGTYDFGSGSQPSR